jgi:hypothetical protein
MKIYALLLIGWAGITVKSGVDEVPPEQLVAPPLLFEKLAVILYGLRHWEDQVEVAPAQLFLLEVNNDLNIIFVNRVQLCLSISHHSDR